MFKKSFFYFILFCIFYANNSLFACSFSIGGLKNKVNVDNNNNNGNNDNNNNGNNDNNNNNNNNVGVDINNMDDNINENINDKINDKINDNVEVNDNLNIGNKILNNENLDVDEFNLIGSDQIKDMFLLHYISVSFIFFNLKKELSNRNEDIFENEGRYDGYKDSLDVDLFAVFKEFGANDISNTYEVIKKMFNREGKTISDFIKKISDGKKNIVSHSDFYLKYKELIFGYVRSEFKNKNILDIEKFSEEEKMWIFALFLNFLTYDKIMKYFSKILNKETDTDVRDEVFEHDIIYISLLSNMMRNIFEKIILSLSLVIPRDKDKDKNVKFIVLESRRNFFLNNLDDVSVDKNIFVRFYENLIFRPRKIENRGINSLDCFAPIINQFKI